MEKLKNWGNFYNKKYKKSDLLRWTRSYPKYFDYILDSGAKTILEVGIGSGFHSILLSLLGFDVTGIDTDEKVIEIAQKNNAKFGGRAKFLKMDAFNLSFQKRFDLVIFQGVLEHYSNDEIGELLKEQLKIGKEIVFDVPSIGYPGPYFGDERLLTKERWIKIIKEQLGPKIKILKAEYDGFRSNNIIHGIFTQKNFAFIFSPWKWRYSPHLLFVLTEI